jgi:hypothetical protein
MAAKRRPKLVLLVPVALLALAGAGLLWQQVAAARQRAADRTQLLADVAAETGKPEPDGSELSRLAARLQKQEDAHTAADLIVAVARIELARDRPDRAFALLDPIASAPGAAPADQRLAAVVQLRRHAAGLSDVVRAAGALRQVIAFAEAAYAESRDAADLLMAWQAAVRLPDAERSAQFAEQIVRDHAGTPAALLVALQRDFAPELPRERIDAVRREFDVAPPELDAMAALVALQGGDVAAAVAIVEPLLARAAGVVDVRIAAALVLHACVAGSDAGSEARAGWVARRDAQLDWLREHAPADHAMRPTWQAMRAVR